MTNASTSGDRFRTPIREMSIYANSREVEAIAATTKRLGMGAFYVAPSNGGRNRLSDLERVAERHFEITGEMPQLDANYYSGTARRMAGSALSIEWAKTQQRLGLPFALTDTGYIDAGNVAVVAEVLSKAAEIQQHLDIPVVAALPIDYMILKENSTQLSDLVQEGGVDVAIMAGHADDPFGTQAAVKGLVEVIGGGETRVALLRSDLSALGALSVGASFAAIGTSASLRHVYSKPGKKGGFGGASDQPSVLVEGAMAWRTLDRVIDIVGRYPDQPVWMCNCDTHWGRRIDSLKSEADVIAHNYDVSLRLWQNVMMSSDPRLTWISMCSQAQNMIFEVEGATGLPWEPPKFLGAWWATQPATTGV